MCCNPNLGLMTKVGDCKGVGQEGSTGVTFHVHKNVEEREGMNPTLPNEFPLCKLESWWTFEFLESDCKGQNPNCDYFSRQNT
jgi:hypothetical protein